MLTYIEGDLVKAFENGEVDVLVHGCNCYCTMGAGIARQIKNKFPKAFQRDLEFDANFEKKSDKLGKFSTAYVERPEHNSGWIINAYTQDTYWDVERMLSYDAIRIIFDTLKQKVHPTHKIGIPLIGCGLACGDWKIVSKILEEIFVDREIFVYYLGVKPTV